MATPYTVPSNHVSDAPAGQWQEPRNGIQDSSNFRSVTPAMNNTRGAVRNPSPAPGRGPSPGAAAKLGGGSNVEAHYAGRSGTPNSRYIGSFNSGDGTQQQQQRDNPNAPTSAGLIRLTLRKPMGIVFEPMYDPNSPSVQRGVRICDLPRTGAAALSRKLEIGDELLSINDKTMSRLTFDEIMDFIIEADPEEVNLLFRRPRKETLNARHGIKTPSSNPSGPGVKWVDDEARKKKDKKKTESHSKKDKKPPRRSKTREDDETAQSEDVEYRSRNRKKSRRKDPYETESFLDILIDTICANPDSVCRDRRRHGDEDDYYSDEDDGTFASRDDSTYVTYESEEQIKKKKEKSKSKSQTRDDDDDSSTYQETEEDTVEDKQRKKKREREREVSRPSPPKESKRPVTPEKPKEVGGKYEDDGTLETVDSTDRPKQAEPQPEQAPPPLGLAPNPEPTGVGQVSDTDDDVNPAPIKEVEYDDQVDHGADVSVMESLGGPSLLIEKQRQAAITAKAASTTAAVPAEILDNFGKDYPLDFGFTREQTIQNDPLRFYTFVVKGLLQEHEPEKVRLLDKLLAKYRGREDHLVQKLSVRYNKDEEEPGMENENEQDFEEAVNKGKDSAHASATIQTARERMQHDFSPPEWPDKETKEPEEEDVLPNQDAGGADDVSESGTEYSGDSIDGTSPAVIAQVSELLNYVYGKTSVPGQIDRVSTIMRAYEGREAVLLELLETKALIKANREKENAGNLPSFLRNSANAQRNAENEIAGGNGDVPPVTPMATQPPPAINDDISSMSGVSTPVVEAQQNTASSGVLKQISTHEAAPAQIPAQTVNVEPKVEQEEAEVAPPTPTSNKSKPPPTPDRTETKKKKKGIFGGLFGGKKGKKNKEADKANAERNGSRPRGLRSPMSRKLKNMASTEASI